MFSVINTVEIVAADAVSINNSIAARNCNGWTLSQLVEKTGAQAVYLCFSKPCAPGDVPSNT